MPKLSCRKSQNVLHRGLWRHIWPFFNKQIFQFQFFCHKKSWSGSGPDSAKYPDPDSVNTGSETQPGRRDCAPRARPGWRRSHRTANTSTWHRETTVTKENKQPSRNRMHSRETLLPIGWRSLDKLKNLPKSCAGGRVHSNYLNMRCSHSFRFRVNLYKPPARKLLKIFFRNKHS